MTRWRMADFVAVSDILSLAWLVISNAAQRQQVAAPMLLFYASLCIWILLAFEFILILYITLTISGETKGMFGFHPNSV